MSVSKAAAQAKSPFARAALAWWLGTGLWAGFIFFMSAHTGSDLDDGAGLIGRIKLALTMVVESLFGPGTDIVSTAGHFLEYTVLGFFLVMALFHTGRYFRTSKSLDASDYDSEITGTHHQKPLKESKDANAWKLKWVLLGAIIIASFYGITDELHQSFVPGRMPDGADWLTDTLGATLGAGISGVVVRKAASRETPPLEP